MTCTTGDPARKPAERVNPLRPLLLLAVLMCAACAPKADADKNIKENIAAFYRLHEAAPPQGALSLSELIRFRPLLSVPLFEKLKDASVAEEAHFAKNAELLAPLFEGDLFTARPQGLSAARVSDCTVNEDHAYCNTELNAADGANIIKWKERIFLVEDERGWVIDDIDFGRNNPPLRQGRLSAILEAGIERGRIEAKDSVSDTPSDAPR
ncbi:MAG TPA: hypothetical protein VNX00_07755 [Herbaspirillum sp.]|nr:hypothetical protein [Herbaspirillum sp.]